MSTEIELASAGRIVESEVLILGGGAAGCMAAIGAREQGANTLIVDKGMIESCGCAGAGNANYHTHLNTGPDWDSDETATKYYSSPGPTGGYGILSSKVFDRAVTKQLIPMLKRLEGIGIEFHKNSDGSYRRTQSFGNPGPWITTMKNGKYFKRLLAKEVRRKGAETAEHVMITSLLVDNSRVSGAIGFNIRNGEFYIFRAKSVVLALGGSQERITTSSNGNPFSCWMRPYNTGSAMVIAYDAGAKIVDLELMTRATLLPKGFGAPGMCAFAGMRAYMVNAKGERYMKRYHPTAERAPRSVLVLASYNELAEGRGPLYIDARHLSEDDLRHMIEDRLYEDCDTYPEYFAQRGLNLGKDLMEIEVSELVGGGMLLVNERCASNLKGLFGYTPAQLSLTLCGGFSSGTEAAKDTRKLKELTKVNNEQVIEEKSKIFEPIRRTTGYTWQDIESKIRLVMNFYMGFIRNEQGMETALHRLKLIERYVNDIKADNYHELMRANETRHLVRYCQLLVRATLERKESGRCFYKRSDYLDLDETWSNKHVILWQENGEPQVSAETIE